MTLVRIFVNLVLVHFGYIQILLFIYVARISTGKKKSCCLWQHVYSFVVVIFHITNTEIIIT